MADLCGLPHPHKQDRSEHLATWGWSLWMFTPEVFTLVSRDLAFRFWLSDPHPCSWFTHTHLSDPVLDSSKLVVARPFECQGGCASSRLDQAVKLTCVLWVGCSSNCVELSAFVLSMVGPIEDSFLEECQPCATDKHTYRGRFKRTGTVRFTLALDPGTRKSKRKPIANVGRPC